jgi:hypothetical protein
MLLEHSFQQITKEMTLKKIRITDFSPGKGMMGVCLAIGL